MSQIGSRARRIRLTRGMTQEATARGAGIALSTYARIEAGVNEPSVSTLVRLAGALGTTVDELLDEPGSAA